MHTITAHKYCKNNRFSGRDKFIYFGESFLFLVITCIYTIYCFTSKYGQVVARWHPFPSCSLSHPHIYTSHLVRCVSGPADLNLMSKCAPCLATPCQNNGTCVSDVTGSYHCTAPLASRWANIYHHTYSTSSVLLQPCTEDPYELCASLHAREPHHPSSEAELAVSEVSWLVPIVLRKPLFV